ncbi:kinase-like domain-containing protein [Mycena vulgaris]|nr:kinase-like domain-containing protein [Mycena vulgaris]
MPQSGTLRTLTGCVVDDGRLELLKVIGAGAYGRLYKARNPTSPSSSYYAVKCLRRPEPRSKDAKFQDRERTLHRRVAGHPNVVSLYRHFTDADHLFLVLEFCPGGDMYRAITDGVYHRQTALIKRTFANLVDAVRFCHSRGVYHRDLKPENILVNFEGGGPLVADFGLCTTSRVSKDMDCGSGSYMAPESFGSGSTSYSPQQSDFWALCIILINLVTSMNPWHSAQINDGRWISFKADPDFLREILPISPSLSDLLRRCFVLDPARRPSLHQLCQEVLALPSLYMSDADLAKASPGVRRAAGHVDAAAAAGYDPSDYSSPSEVSTSGSGYSSLDAHPMRPVNLPPSGLAPPSGGSRLAVPAPASTTGSPSASKVPFESSSRAALSSAADSEGPLTPHAHLVQLPSGSVSSGQQQQNTPATAGKFKRFMRRLRVWRKV